MIIKLTKNFYVDHEAIETVRFYEKGDAWYSPTVTKCRETFKESTFQATFKRSVPVRLVGTEADEAWANWTAHADRPKQ